jgi:hypothetical protein
LLIQALLVASIAFACKPLNRRTAAETKDAPALPTREIQAFGAKLGNSPEVPLAQVLQSPSDYSGKTVRVEGHVRRACSAKGCWMELAPNAEPSAPGCRVTFKDYGFFVPTDSAGSSARVEAEVNLKRVLAAHVRHYEGEGATFASKHEDGSADEVRLIATGVELRR